MHSYYRYLLPLLLVSAVQARAQLTLPDAIAEAVANNPELLAARQKIESATGRAVQARLWPNPELELSAQDMPVESAGLSRSKNMVGVAQTVPFPGKKTLDARIGARGISAAEWEYRSREIELVGEVKAAFYRALAVQRKLAIGEQLAELANATALAARKRVEAGSAADQEQLRGEIEQDRVAVELSATRSELAGAQRMLAALLGRSRAPVGGVEGELADRVARPPLDLAREQMLARHPNVRAALANRERAELEWRRARLDPLPDVRLGIAGGRDTAAHETLMEFRVSVPLPLFDRAQGRQREAHALAEIARYDLSATELRLTRALDLLDERLRAAGEQVDLYRTRILPKAESAARLVRSGFEAGKFGLLDMLDTQRTTAAVRLAYYDKLLELNTAQAELEALLLLDVGRDGPPGRPSGDATNGAPGLPAPIPYRGRALPTK